MSFQNILNKLQNEIKGKNRDDVIKECEEILSEKVEEISQNDAFFSFTFKKHFIYNIKS